MFVNAPFGAGHWPAPLYGRLAPHLGDRHPTLRRGRTPAPTRLRSEPVPDTGSRPCLRVSPGNLRFCGAAGARVQARLHLENLGAVPLVIDKVFVTGVFDDGGIEAALASACHPDGDGIHREDSSAFCRLREAHGGLLRLRVLDGAGILMAGERRVILLETTLGSGLHPGLGYHGVLRLGAHSMAVRLHVTECPK